MAPMTIKRPRFKLQRRMLNTRATSADYPARMALIDRIADLPGIETVQRSEENVPHQIEIYLRREAADRVLKRRPARLLCSLDGSGVTVSGLGRWERYQVLANGWGKLINDQVHVYMPRNHREVDIVWSIVREAYDKLSGPVTPEAGTLVVSTWDWPRFSRTRLQ